MSKIKVFALGGLDENGKNCYVIDINDDLFIFDCGLKDANESLFGIDYIIPSFEYLIANKNRIKGLFLTHGHYDNIGAVADFIIDLPNVPIFATKFTKYALLDEEIPEKNIVEITPYKAIKFKNASIFPLKVSHSAPDAVMYVINTEDGSIVYTGDFIIDPTMNEAYGMDLGKIAYVGKQGVLLLLSESVFSEKEGHTSPHHRLEPLFRDLINRHDKRMMFVVLPNHLSTIQDIFDASKNSHRKIIAMGKKLQSIISIGQKEGYLKFDQHMLGDLSNIKDQDAILLISEDKEKPYASIERIIHGYDKYITLTTDDQIIFAVPRNDSNEKQFVKIEDQIAILGASDVTIPKDKTVSLHASKEDLMIMLDLLKPKYYMPVKGEYRYMVGNADLAFKLGMPKDNILLKQNGDVVNIVNKQLVNDIEHITVNDVLIDGKSSDNVGELVVKDREMLSENGIVLISTTLDRKTKKVLAGPEITTRGFIYIKDSIDMINHIKELSSTIVNRHIENNYVDYNGIKSEIREELGKYLYEETECKPLIIAVIQEI